MNKTTGFTLLEVVVVLAIIGVLMGIAVATIRFNRGEHFLDDQAEQLVQSYRAMRDEAVLSGIPRRLVADANSLTAEVRDDDRIAFFPDAQIPPLQWPDERHLSLELFPNKPIYAFPSGQTTPFRLTLRYVDTDETFTRLIEGDAMGRITLSIPETQ